MSSLLNKFSGVKGTAAVAVLALSTASFNAAATDNVAETAPAAGSVIEQIPLHPDYEVFSTEYPNVPFDPSRVLTEAEAQEKARTGAVILIPVNSPEEVFGEYVAGNVDYFMEESPNEEVSVHFGENVKGAQLYHNGIKDQVEWNADDLAAFALFDSMQIFKSFPKLAKSTQDQQNVAATYELVAN